MQELTGGQALLIIMSVLAFIHFAMERQYRILARERDRRMKCLEMAKETSALNDPEEIKQIADGYYEWTDKPKDK